MKLINTREVVKALVPKYAKGKTLDIGGGSAKYRALITPHVSEYLVSDLYHAEGVDFQEDARKLTHADDSFDTILCFQALEHIDDTTAVVREMYRVVRKGGYAVVATPFLCPEHGHPSDYHRFTVEGLKWYFEQAGFETIETGKQGGTLSVISEILRFTLLNPYKKHSRLRTAVMTRVNALLLKLDRKGFLENKDLYNNVYVVARK